MSDSNSESSQATNYSDSRMVLGQDAINAQSGATVNSSTTTNTTNYALDGGAISGALNLGSDALAFGSDALASNNKTSGNAFDLVGGVLNEALGFGTKTVNSSFDFANSALADSLANERYAQQQAAQQASDAIAFAQASSAQSAAAQKQALDAATGSMADALAYGGKQTAIALDSLNGSAELVKNAYADAKGRGAMTDYLLMAAIGVAGLVAYSALRK
jgi:hypothetical protein